MRGGEEVQWVRKKNTRRGRKGRRVKNELSGGGSTVVEKEKHEKGVEGEESEE